ncbi:hypothetical protein [Brevibacillus reuszeri]|uniref:hypothetical protein n=1 Tax=Brevibacillus reuszeri TaxID=54915 RepID=UPI00289B7897|nr:hypothetical protein [Brevibacillus reuszeri]
MFSKAKLGMLLGTMAAVLSLGSLGSALAADTAQTQAQDQQWNKPAHVKFAGDKMDHRGGFGMKVSFKENTELLSLLKLDADQLQEELKAGKSLAEIAKAQGVDTDDVVALLVKEQEAKLAEAVKAGKLTQEQADKMTENASERLKEQVENTHTGNGFDKGRGFGGGFEKNEELLSLLKLDADKLQEELKAGKSLAEVAKAQGVDTDDVVALLVKEQEAKLAEAVKAGKLTQEQADKLAEKSSEHAKAQVENTHQGRGFGMAFGGGFEKNEELLSLLKLNADGLKEALKADKSLAAVAQAQGVSTDDMVALLVKEQEAKLAEAVKAGKLTQEQADKMNENATDRVKAMVEGTHQGRGPGKGMGFGFGIDKNEELLSLLNLDAAKLQEALKSGKSLATIAKEQGVDVEDVVATLVKQHEAQVKEAVAAGKLTQEQADERNEKLTEMVQKMVDGSFEKVVFPRKDKDAKEAKAQTSEE